MIQVHKDASVGACGETRKYKACLLSIATGCAGAINRDSDASEKPCAQKVPIPMRVERF